MLILGGTEEGYLRQQVQYLLDQCTVEQQAFFGRLYPQGLDKMSVDQLKNGLRLCSATITKNERGEE